MSTRDDDLPCGHCATGVYAAGAVREGLRMFGGIETRKAALAAAPHCKGDPGHICFGARDFIVSCKWPLDAAAMAEIEGWISA